MKKWLAIFIMILLMLWLKAPALAGEKKIFGDYALDENGDSYGLQFGFAYDAEIWGWMLRHQLDGAGDNEANTYLEFRRLLFKDYTMTISYEAYEAQISPGIKMAFFRPLKERLWFGLSAAYNLYQVEQDEPGEYDYGLFKLASELQYQVNKPLLVLIGGEWTAVSYEKDPAASDPDYQELMFSVGLVYQFNEAWRLKGVYYHTNTECQAPELDLIWGGGKDKLTIIGFYTFGKYTIFSEFSYYSELPLSQNDDVSRKIGVEYTF